MALRRRLAFASAAAFLAVVAAIGFGAPSFAAGKPPTKPPVTKPPPAKPPEKPKNLIEVATAQADPALKKFLEEVKAGDLTSTLTGAGPFTVFAFTDAAWDKLTDDQKKELGDAKNKAKLTGILKYHVVAKKFLLADLLKVTTLKTLNGASLTIKLTDDKASVTIDDVKLEKTDIVAGNGVLHVIGAVLMPAADPAKPPPPK